MAGKFDGFYQYVPHGFLHAFEALGWERLPALEGTHHGQYSALCRWAGDGDPRYPAKENSAA